MIKAVLVVRISGLNLLFIVDFLLYTLLASSQDSVCFRLIIASRGISVGDGQDAPLFILLRSPTGRVFETELFCGRGEFGRFLRLYWIDSRSDCFRFAHLLRSFIFFNRYRLDLFGRFRFNIFCWRDFLGLFLGLAGHQDQEKGQ
jgi:hypothetical protein